MKKIDTNEKKENIQEERLVTPHTSLVSFPYKNATHVNVTRWTLSVSRETVIIAFAHLLFLLAHKFSLALENMSNCFFCLILMLLSPPATIADVLVPCIISIN
jgi:hypothetical protein